VRQSNTQRNDNAYDTFRFQGCDSHLEGSAAGSAGDVEVGMVKVVRFHETGGPAVLRIEDLPRREPGPGDVSVRVEAIGLNRAEALFRSGQYLEAATYPARIGYEAAGVVDAVGEDVEAFRPGDVVSVVPAFSMNAYGTYGEQAIVPARAVVKTPPGVSSVQAAALWMQYLTAYGALIDIGGLTSGDFVVIPAASSSVGLAAIQIARMVGATSIATTRTSAKKQALLDAGASRVIATEEEDLVAEVMRLTGGRGARLVFDPVAGPYVETLADATAKGGTIFVYGLLSLQPTPFPLFQGAGERPHAARIHVVRDHGRSGATLPGSRIRRARTGRRRTRADHRPDLPARRDRRGAPVPGIQRTDRQDRRHRQAGRLSAARAPMRRPCR
jgi:NADPH:quinone reductase-like Zn-dependent oxidoreductase